MSCPVPSNLGPSKYYSSILWDGKRLGFYPSYPRLTRLSVVTNLYPSILVQLGTGLSPIDYAIPVQRPPLNKTPKFYVLKVDEDAQDFIDDA